ncbi:hypothetical protein JCM10908_003863 [Rhodotorula pacifica]|uniref:uncharacterized protein n=1 Tax=Rhodotorula pacifica TaxID=1495444 RepID=UPI003182273E
MGIVHVDSVVPQIQDFQVHELPSLLEPLLQSGWQCPRTDMQHWIRPPNRSDEIVETKIPDYDLGSMLQLQTTEFTPRTKELVLSVLAFQKLLLENSTDRKIFNAFDRISDLLHTTDIDVLLAALRLALQPAHQSLSYKSSLSSMPFSEKRLLSPAQPWATREHSIGMMKIAQDGPFEVPLELQEPEWQFYRKVDKAPTAATDATADEDKLEVDEMDVEAATAAEATASTSANVSSTPAPPRRTASFAPHLHTPSRETAPSGSALLPGTPANPAAPATTASDKPQEGLTTASESARHSRPPPTLASERQRLLVVRLLALAVFAHAQSEQSAQLKVFLYEPDIIAQIAELVHPEKDVPVEIKSVALYALEAFARYKGKTAEVASALNASISHGVLMELVRKTAADLDSDQPESTAEFIDALFNVLTYINVHQAIGQMVIGAGIVDVLLDFVKISSRGHLQMIAANKAVVILDGFPYGYTNACTAYIAASGLEAFIGRVKSEVDSAVEEHREEAEKREATVVENSTGLLSFQQGSVLKSILRATHRLMTTSGTTEGLRNLIDTSILASAKKVMENRFIFGPQVFALVTNIAATFVHNEPTSLTTLQEAKVSDALYDSLERAIPASNDVLQAVPNAIGAFCLNQAGLDHFLTRDLISKYFAVFTSPAHYELLRDRDSAVNLGAAIDELVRHHPTLKARILDAIFDSFVEFKRMGAEYVPPASESGYNLQPPTVAGAAGASEDVAMQEGATPVTEQASVEGSDKAKDRTKVEDDKTKDNEVTNAIDVFGRFLEGLFQNVGHTQDFIEREPFDLLLDLLELPCSPAIMLKNGGYSSIVALFRISSEIKAAEALTAILGRTDKWLIETKSASAILLSHVSLLSDVFTNLSYARGKAATVIISVFTVKGPQSEILQRTGQVYRACLWENVTIRPTSFWSGEASKAATEQLAQNAPDGEAPTPAVAVARERQQAQAAEVAAREVISTPATPDSPNIKLVQDVARSFTHMTLPLYETIVKLLVHRRSSDASHRKVARAVAQQIAGFIRDTLAWPNAQDLPASLAYSAQSLVLVTKLSLDERPNGLQTLLLRHSLTVGGLDAYVALFKELLDVSSDYFASSGNDASAASPLIIPVIGELKTALDFLGRITPWLRKCPQNVIRSLVSTSTNILKAEGEAPSEAPARAERILGQVIDGGNLGAAGGLLGTLGAVFGGAGGGGGAAALLGGPGGPAGGA